METKTLRERKTKTLKEETKNERETTSERNTLSHTCIEPLRKGDSNTGRFKLKEGEIKKLKKKGR